MSAARQEFLTVEQTAVVCGIGRTSAYQLARRAADHGEGDFPAVRFGKQLRVPRKKLEELIGGPITLPTDPPAAPQLRRALRRSTSSGSPMARATSPKRSAPSATADQPSLPFHHPVIDMTDFPPLHSPRTDECTVAFGNQVGGRE